jgi:Fur family ferric uptake transcriptional regulator
MKCGRVDDVLVDPGPMIDEALAEIGDYEILGHRIEFVGLCPECRKEHRPVREREEPRIGIPDRPMSNVG